MQVFFVGRKRLSFNQNMLPSKKDVFGRLLYLVQEEKRSVNESISIVAEELMKIYTSFEIPTKRKDGIEKQILRNYNEYDNIRRSKNNVRPGVEIQERKFTDSLEVLFDDAVATLKKDKKQQAINFLNEHRDSMITVRTKLSLGSNDFAAPAPVSAQRSTRASTRPPTTASTFIAGPSRVVNVDLEVQSCSYPVDTGDVYSEIEEAEQEDTNTDTEIETTEMETTEMETEGSTYSPPRKIIRRKNIENIQTVIDSSMTQVLDRFRVPNDAASIIIGQVAYLLGHDVKSLFISPEHIRMQRIKYRAQIYNIIKQQFSANAAFTVHWDTKVLADCTSVDQLTCNRLAIILSSNGNSKVLGIPKVSSQKGADEGAAVYSALLDWNVQEKVMAMCFDTTASNTSTSIGACAVLEQKLNRHLLHFGCRHHIMELLVGAAFKSTVEPVTSAPNILLFERFRTTWADLDHESFELGISDPEVVKYFPDNIRNGLINFIKDQIQNKVENTRHDYIEFLKLSLLFLGEKIPEYRIPKPGAVSRARWMGKNNYSLKIFLFRNQFNVSGKTFLESCIFFCFNFFFINSVF